MNTKQIREFSLKKKYKAFVENCLNSGVSFHTFEEFKENMERIEAIGHEVNAFDEYQEHTGRTAGTFENKKEALVAWSMGIGGEAGEYIDGIKKHVFHGHELDSDAQAKELGDLLFYISESAKTLGYKLSEIVEMNIRKLEKRYPDGFSEERSKNRVD